ncbi:MAG: histidine phosphatase family protein [Flavobacteriaceae bacterium]|nr:histidine phosphatase family protein [Flavobacteriaceae bacterium]
MKKFILLSLILVIFSCKNSENKEIVSTSEEKSSSVTPIDDTETIYYLIRHAEKDRSDASNEDPGLTEEGLKRAKYWATYFSDKGINQIFSTEFNRTQLTAYYVAQDYFIGVQNYTPNEIYTEDFKLITKGEKTLIVGHSNTIPRLVNNMLMENKFPDMDDTDNSSLYIVTVKGESITAEQIKVDIQ